MKTRAGTSLASFVRMEHSATPGLHAVDALQQALCVPPAMTSEGRRWKEVTACLWKTPRLVSYELAETDELIVALHTGGMSRVRMRFGRGWSSNESNPGPLHVIPAGVPTGFKPQGELEFFSVHIGAERVRRLADTTGSNASGVPF